ncbi:MAG: pyrroloquinoline quinone biosynthesis peptide chaperone PqqD [Desulfuromonas sp.]|nr:MAG: pyrroloquinoline quinone biosynthesis peptide chaperone PqqD [Desulfuromonas sp.]
MVKPKRNPDVIWRHEQRREQQLLEAAERGEDISEGGTVILVVNGTMHQLNLLGGEIWRRCDGETELAAIVQEIGAEYEVAAEELEQDVREFLVDLQQRGWVTDA